MDVINQYLLLSVVAHRVSLKCVSHISDGTITIIHFFGNVKSVVAVHLLLTLLTAFTY